MRGWKLNYEPLSGQQADNFSSIAYDDYFLTWVRPYILINESTTIANEQINSVALFVLIILNEFIQQVGTKVVERFCIRAIIISNSWNAYNYYNYHKRRSNNNASSVLRLKKSATQWRKGTWVIDAHSGPVARHLDHKNCPHARTKRTKPVRSVRSESCAFLHLFNSLLRSHAAKYYTHLNQLSTSRLSNTLSLPLRVPHPSDEPRGGPPLPHCAPLVPPATPGEIQSWNFCETNSLEISSRPWRQWDTFARKKINAAKTTKSHPS